MPRLFTVLALCSLLSFASGGPGFAAPGVSSDSPLNHCYNGSQTTQQGLNQCAQKAYQQVDAELNRLYKQIQSKQGRKLDQQRFQTAQLAWIKFRDLQCAYASGRYEGGTIAPLIHSQCLTDITLLRNQYFRQFLKDMSR